MERPHSFVRVDIVQLTSDEQTLDDTHVVCAQFSPGKRPIFPTHRDHTMLIALT